MLVPREIPPYLARLPHRHPFHFVSEVAELVPRESARGIWRVDGSEDFFAGHFPGRPILPGVLIAEALAQISGLIAFADDGGHAASTADPAPSTLAQVDVRFHAPVNPPAEIVLESKWRRTLGRLMQFEVSAQSEGIRVADGWITLAINAGSEADAK